MTPKVIITGGAGFIGYNTSQRFLDKGYEVVVFDNLSRKGVSYNLQALSQKSGLVFVQGDIRNYHQLCETFTRHRDTTAIIHLAGQTAVTTSVDDPRTDFEINALGTFNVLEALRTRLSPEVVFINASTNKVYGGMEQAVVVEHPTRYAYRDYPSGIDEDWNLDFHSPYGCSKGAADQYTRDYHRIYGLRTVVFRQSCIYGYRQFGVEDQGWVAWFVIAALFGKPITIYGDGKQVRDVLFIDDLVELYLLAVQQIDRVAGRVYNVGGGPDNTLSVWAEFGPLLTELLGQKIEVTYRGWRPGDQRIFIADIGRIRDDLGWSPQVGVREGITRLCQWAREHKALFEKAGVV